MRGSVCVIIPSVGNSTELGVAIDGLLAQTYSDVSIVVVGPESDPGKDMADLKGVRFIDDMGSKTRADACNICLLYTSPSPRDRQKCRMPSSA